MDFFNQFAGGGSNFGGGFGGGGGGGGGRTIGGGGTNFIGGGSGQQPTLPSSLADLPDYIQELLQRYDEAYEEGRAANEERYAQGLQGFQDRYDRNLGYFDQDASSSYESFLNRLAGLRQGYDDRTSTIMDALSGGYSDLIGQREDDSAALLGGYDQRTSDILSELRGDYGSVSDLLRSRGDEIGEGYQQRLDDALENISQLGGFERERIDRDLRRANSQATQSASRRGLYNTTVLDSLERGNREDAGFQRMDLAERLARLRTDYGSRLSGEMLANQQQNLGLQAALGQRRADQLANYGSSLTGDALRAGQYEADQLANLRRQGLESQAGYGERLSGDALRSLESQNEMQTSLDNLLRSQRIDLDTRLSGDRLGFLERRTDTYPSLSDMANFLLQAGSASPQAFGASPNVSGGTLGYQPPPPVPINYGWSSPWSGSPYQQWQSRQRSW